MSDNEITVHRLRIGKDKLSAIPDNERNLLFMLAHIANEISILQKLQGYMGNFEYPANTDAESDALTSQSLFMGRLYIGKLNEAQNFIRSIFLRTELGKIYTPLLDPKGQEALNSLKSCFRKGTFINDVRNNFAFHYLAKDWSLKLTNVFDKINEDECVFYVSEKRGNTHWYGAEVVVNYALLDMIDAENPEMAMDRIMDESLDVGAWIMDFIDRCIVAIVQKHLGFDFVSDSLEPITISNAPDPRDVSVRFFIQRPDDF